MNFVFDIDGTLCFDGTSIEDDIITAIHELQIAGHEVVFASARPIRDLLPVLPESLRSTRLVGGNGCYVLQHGQVTTSFLQPNLIEQLTALIDAYQLTYLADGEWHYSFTGSIEHPIYCNINKAEAKHFPIGELSPICKLVLFHPTEEIIAMLNTMPVALNHYVSEQAIDISPLGIDKVYGLHQLGIERFIAFGNDRNDVCMFKQADYSICVGDQDVQQFASKQINRHEVAQTIRELKEYKINTFL